MRKPNLIDANFAKELARYEDSDIQSRLNEFIDVQPSCNEILYWAGAWIGCIGFIIGMIIGGL